MNAVDHHPLRPNRIRPRVFRLSPAKQFKSPSSSVYAHGFARHVDGRAGSTVCSFEIRQSNKSDTPVLKCEARKFNSKSDPLNDSDLEDLFGDSSKVIIS